MTKLVMVLKGTMRTAKISELKAKLNAYIELVKNGEEVLILDGNKPVAWLVAPGPVEEQDTRRRHLIVKGVITPAKKPRVEGDNWPIPPGRMISREVMDQIWEEERKDRC
jgi:antitoxin (DNA-binding transcriptional repressor) of toxin-antitoxin stability system